jgi:DNA-binding NarL/FixJ family response regulator
LATVLHNDLQQLLVAAGLRLERLANTEDNADRRLAIGQIETLISQSVASTRSLATDLKPPVLNSANLTKSLHWLADWLWKRFDFTLKISVPEDLQTSAIPDEDIVFLFDTARELCFNIVKHAHVKEGRMTLQRTAQDRLRVSIADDGVGMDLEQQDLPISINGGLGLGAIRDRLALIGGELHVISSVGQGFCADITMPYALTASSRPMHLLERQKDKVIAGAGSSPPVKKIRVMLVDDHAVVRDGLKMILLDESDIDVIGEAGDGEKAVKMAGKLMPDVILMDVNMPKMSGIESTKLIKQSFPEICVIALSINDDPGTNNAMIEAGASAYLNKSGSADKVCQMIRACLRGCRKLKVWEGENRRALERRKEREGEGRRGKEREGKKSDASTKPPKKE